ncbi:hypothetical protein [Candidatus Electronema sp. JM]|uniref:hypothetical protein n=1 Tax=Candidatus Electronema sp. JM TaxID=3401571 RepID=UPI003AA89A7E
MNLHNPFALAGIAFLLAAVFWFLLSKSRKSSKAASGRLDATQVIYLLSLLAMLALAVLTWNDRAISMSLLGSLLGSVATGASILKPAKEDTAELRTIGDQSPSVRSGGKVTISYGGAVSGRKKAGAGQAVTQGGQSPAVEAKKDVEITYEK